MRLGRTHFVGLKKINMSPELLKITIAKAKKNGRNHAYQGGDLPSDTDLTRKYGDFADDYKSGYLASYHLDLHLNRRAAYLKKCGKHHEKSVSTPVLPNELQPHSPASSIPVQDHPTDLVESQNTSSVSTPKNMEVAAAHDSEPVIASFSNSQLVKDYPNVESLLELDPYDMLNSLLNGSDVYLDTNFHRVGDAFLTQFTLQSETQIPFSPLQENLFTEEPEDFSMSIYKTSLSQ